MKKDIENYGIHKINQEKVKEFLKNPVSF